MKKIVLCVPNISEGKDCEKINLIASVVEMPGSKLLDMSSDTNHNRSVITFGGEPEAVKQAAFNLIKKAAELIDMSKHKGEHPRMGAVDVCPFVPVAGMTMQECARLAWELGWAVGCDLGLSGYFYGYAAKKPERKKLSDIRAGEYEALPKKLEKPEWRFDFGLPEFNPSFGATVIGARDFLIAFNVNLRGDDLDLARAIARTVRGSSNGIFSNVQALGIDTREKGYVQVSMNLLNYKIDPIAEVFQAIKNFAVVFDAEIHSSEIIGLVPRDALRGVSIEYLQLKDFDPQRQIIEEALGL
ncbi:MAG: glutamate formimidoyltransferase [Candidatus Portnoybacteria bacterium CG_4_10_14_0_2_um_filter_44_20]|uniref:glutamate formimidoyltransferase n=1 Tax=Candidatus Portnoybacteria bacterium CG_4_10_14_0_2_um_filter_44_20 TaxID=1974799 RepID=A0A2M7UD71_9BACT|nr:MAG: glutamate formimidoyltransferase [Candidatus Portnoybacteria bacterium CG_4_10_14_0_2_um_filter_44_20]